MAVSIDQDRCNGCGTCVPDCMLGALAVTDGIAMADEDLCVECGVCTVDSCPVEAISLPA